MSLKNRERFSSTMDKELLKRLYEVQKETEIPMSKLLDKAIKLLLESWQGK